MEDVIPMEDRTLKTKTGKIRQDIENYIKDERHALPRDHPDRLALWTDWIKISQKIALLKRAWWRGKGIKLE